MATSYTVSKLSSSIPIFIILPERFSYVSERNVSAVQPYPVKKKIVEKPPRNSA
jgi:hypothetical protein